MWPDSETRTDYLNYDETAALVADLISQERLRPLSVGVFGGWGAGKSSLIQMTKTRFEDNDDYIVLNFDAWLYQGFDDARASLLHSIGEALRNAASETEGLSEKIKQFTARIDRLRVLGLVAELGAAAVGFPVFGAINRGAAAASSALQGDRSAENLADIRDAAGDIAQRSAGLLRPPENAAPPDEVKAFRSEFSEILDSIGKTLVVFIDNLDRCLPRNTIHTLEAVRLFLFLPRTAFVIAADEEMIRLSVADHYSLSSPRLVTDYLDKFVQVGVRVPRPGSLEIRAYLLQLWLEAQPGESAFSADQLKQIQKYIEKHLRETWKGDELDLSSLEAAVGGTAGLSGEQRLAIKEAFYLSSRIAPILAKSKRVSGNPRIIKRLLNTVRARLFVAKRRGMGLDEALILKLALFERCMSEAATAELMSLISQSKNGRVPLFEELEKQGVENTQLPDSWEKDSAFLNDWIALSPPLSEIDLRPALYLARELAPANAPLLGLSAAAQAAMRTLQTATQVSSPVAQSAASTLADEDAKAVMDGLIETLSGASDWGKRPSGFAGAVILADRSQEAAASLAAFLRSKLTPIPPWARQALKSKTWWEGS